MNGLLMLLLRPENWTWKEIGIPALRSADSLGYADTASESQPLYISCLTMPS